jgi:O-antigen/teichoic acid export membrane protein
MLPWLARAEHTGEFGVAKGYALGMTAVNALLLPIALTLVLFARPIVELLYGSSFSSAVLPLQLLGMMALLFGINSFASTLLIARDRPGAYARLLAPVIVQNISFNLVLIPRYGANGAAFSAIVSSVLLAALGVWQARRVIGQADLVGAFAGPLLGGAAMIAIVLAAHLRWPLEAVLGLITYAGVLGGFEWLMRRDDARIYLSAFALWSRPRAGRTTA